MSSLPPSLLLLLLFLLRVSAHPHYALLLPHAHDVFHDDQNIAAIGHINFRGHGALNQFGKDFVLAGRKWTRELCEMDSDGDGRTNGEELGDASCEWKRHDDGDVPVYHGKRFTHPGVTNVGKWPEEGSDEETLSMEVDPYLDMEEEEDEDEDEDEEEWDGLEEED